jgi:hypothetical protein
MLVEEASSNPFIPSRVARGLLAGILGVLFPSISSGSHPEFPLVLGGGHTDAFIDAIIGLVHLLCTVQ